MFRQAVLEFTLRLMFFTIRRRSTRSLEMEKFQGQKDVLGREYRGMGFSESVAIPVGSRVRIVQCDYLRLRTEAHVGREAVTLLPAQPDRDRGFYQEQLVRLVQPATDCYVSDSLLVAPLRSLEVLTVGDGTVMPRRDYVLSKREIYDARFAKMDHRIEGWTNAATFIAHLYLRNSHIHYEAMRAFRRAGGSINPARIKSYFYRNAIQIDDWAKFPEGFPRYDHYRYQIDWNSIAGEFNQVFAEADRHRAIA
ncbi:hypothetical protein F6X40_10445 [Paraburkholderia sp. UCT31]|uniref:hypothetical protein n=1 Tax=Paraburkholderia sp. UCT31 TaxID=2615209 RepID=UPI001655960D|nr:hypothetical protein [Paraburkholderia sp. UCT31]MBC8737226.1 hypothetical protein [Paraburkholderia sp. UCT31]